MGDVLRGPACIEIASRTNHQRGTRDRVAVVPSFLLFLIPILVGSKRWGDACAYQGPPLGTLTPLRKKTSQNILQIILNILAGQLRKPSKQVQGLGIGKE